MRVLAVVSEPISAADLRRAIPPERLEDVEVMVVAPALHASALRFWLSDADAAIERAWEVEHESVTALRTQRIPAAGNVGEGDLGQAVKDALVTFPAERILLFTHAADDRRYREDVSADELADDVGVAVEVVELRA